MLAAIAVHLGSQLMRYRQTLQIRELNPIVIIMVNAQIHFGVELGRPVPLLNQTSDLIAVYRPSTQPSTRVALHLA